MHSSPDVSPLPFAPPPVPHPEGADGAGDDATAKEALIAELTNAVRRSQSATARFDQAVADAAGLNRTDMACLDVLTREGPQTAGELAQQTGLSTGAMTAALDRLERAGYARRARDAGDRRRVIVEPTTAVQRLHAYYAEHSAYAEQLGTVLTTDQMELLLWFFTANADFNERSAQQLEQARPAAGGGVHSRRSGPPAGA